MTVSTTISPIVYNGDGATVNFSFTFPILKETHITVTIKDEDGNYSLKSLTTDYSVSGVGNRSGGTNYSSGTVTFVTAPLSTDIIIISRNTPLTQDTDYIENDKFPAETHEEALDKLTLQIQEVDLIASRSLYVPLETSGVDNALPAPIASNYLRWNSDGDAIEYTAGSSVFELSSDPSPQLGGDLSLNGFKIDFPTTPNISDVLDEDAMTSDSATALATQQSIKAYADTKLSALSDDPTPQLAGNLNVTGYEIVSSSAGNIVLNPDTTGNINLSAVDVLIAEDLIHAGDEDTKLAFGIDTLDIQTGGSSRVDISDSGLRLGGSGARVASILDEDDLVSDSDTAIPTQQSVKAYVDGAASGITDIVDDLTPQLGGDLDVNGNEITSISGGNIQLHSDNDINLILGDAAGVDDFNIKDSGLVDIFSITSEGDVTLVGTIDGRDLAVDGTKLDGIEALADVTDETNVLASLDGATISGITLAGTDKVLVQDISDSDNLRTVTAQDIANLGVEGGALDNVVDDLTPQLGGDLDVNGFDIVSVSAGDINLIPDTTGSISLLANDIFVNEDIVHNGDTDTKITFTADTITATVGGGESIEFTTAGAQLGGTGPIISSILDEDTMTSNSATALATQQSIKAYADTKLSALSDDASPTLGGNLVVGGYQITSTSAGNITLNPDTTGDIILSAADVHVGTNILHEGDTDTSIAFGTDSISLYSGGSNKLDITTSGVRLGLANARVTTILDEDDMVSDSATALATQQSIKAYVDAASPPVAYFSQLTASNSATIEFTDLPSGPHSLIIYGYNIVPSSDGVGLRLRTSEDNGTSYNSGASDYEQSAAGASSYMSVYSDWGSSTGECGSFVAELIGYSQITGTSATMFTPKVSVFRSAGDLAALTAIVSSRKNTSAINAIQFSFTSGNIESGTFVIYSVGT